jgi:protein phosphatase methylesterase 1
VPARTLLLAGALCACRLAAAEALLPVIVDDAELQAVVERARSEFLAQQDFDRLQVTVLVEDRTGRWLRGAVEGSRLAYPASCAKLAFLVGAVHWCAGQGHAPDCLDEFVRPMIHESDNVSTGIVVDKITGAPNAALAGTDAEAWLEKRSYTEGVLERAGLLDDQRLLTKTYPSNSGDEPAGLEKFALERHGRNAMSADGAARLMLAIASGAIEPQATRYMRSLLRRPTFSEQGSLGGGLPAGSLHENKIGNAYDTLEDVIYAELPNGRRLVIAAFSNGWNQSEDQPWDVARLGRFTELVIAGLGLDRGLEPARYLSAVELPEAGRTGGWERGRSRGSFSSAGHLASDGQPGTAVSWTLDAASAGRYEIAVWYPATAAATASAQFEVEHAGGHTTVILDQRNWGSRWIRLGDFELSQDGGKVRLTARSPGQLVADTLRVRAWPQQASHRGR